MNVLNVPDIERELRLVAARALHPSARLWFTTVARNHILGRLPEKDVQTNFRLVTTDLAQTDHTLYRLVRPKELPAWAFAALSRREPVHWFDPVQVGRRDLWRAMTHIQHWFNYMKPADTRLRRLDRISFPVAMQAATLWNKDVSANIWDYVVDKPMVVLKCDHGFTFVKLVSALQFEREGHLQGHCVGNGSYYNRWRTTGLSEYFSLRDQNNQPHATLEVTYEHSMPGFRKGTIMQCKGRGNLKPASQYQPYLRQFVTEMKFTIGGAASHIDDENQ